MRKLKQMELLSYEDVPEREAVMEAYLAVEARRALRKRD